MKFINKHSTLGDDAGNRLAILIAGHILRVKAKLAKTLSGRFNAYSIRKRKIACMALLLVASMVLIAGLFDTGYSIPRSKQKVILTGHIGEASDIHGANPAKQHIIDSLTIKY